MNHYVIIVSGGRDFKNEELLRRGLDQLLIKRNIMSFEFVSGRASGVDTLTEKYCKERNFKFTPFTIKRNRYGATAESITANKWWTMRRKMVIVKFLLHSGMGKVPE